jgi:hypothetical protein
MKKSAPDYNGQPRTADGKFSRGKQNGSRAKGRHLGARNMAGINHLPPYHAPRPTDRRPGTKALTG